MSESFIVLCDAIGLGVGLFAVAVVRLLAYMYILHMETLEKGSFIIQLHAELNKYDASGILTRLVFLSENAFYYTVEFGVLPGDYHGTMRGISSGCHQRRPPSWRYHRRT